MNKIKYKNLVLIIILFATIIRVIYVIKMPYYQNQHDWVNHNDGHRDYIYLLYKDNKLSETNSYQFYHPPLHHIISAIWMKGLSFFISDINTLFESLQFLTCIYTILMMVICLKILTEFKVSEKCKLLILLIIGFFPLFIILSGSLNNDTLSILLMLWAVYRLIKWNKKPNLKNIIFLAIITGLAVMTKTIAGIISVPILYVFLLKLYRFIKKKQYSQIKKYIGLYAIFGVISLSLGLWYQIRNFILFGQPILYVLDPNAPSLYIGDCKWFDRLIPISKELIEMYCNVSTDYNNLIIMFKTSLFGEYIWNTNLLIIYYLAIIFGLIFWSFVVYGCMSKEKYKIKRNIVEKILLLIIIIVNILSYIVSNINLPYTCTADFRYLVIAFISAIILSLISIDSNRNQKLLEIFIIVSILVSIFADILIVTA